MNSPKAWIVFSVCCASSRVGDRMSTWGLQVHKLRGQAVVLAAKLAAVARKSRRPARKLADSRLAAHSFVRMSIFSQTASPIMDVLPVPDCA